jgi:hypothetical protein
MKAITEFKKFITQVTCTSLLITQVAFAESPTPQQPPQNAQETAQVAQVQKNEEKPHDANYCMEDASLESTIKSCEDKNLKYNCHLKRCVNYEDNKVYNEEYNDCGYHSTEEAKESCRNNLKSVAGEIDSTNQTVDSASGVADKEGKSSAETASTVLSAGLAIKGAVELGCLLASGGSLLDMSFDCWSKPVAMGVGALAFMYQMSAKGKYESKFKAAKDMLKNIDKSDEKGWNHNTQIATLDMQIKALEMIIEASNEKIKYHQTLLTMSAASLVFATAEAIICSMIYSGCPQNVGCAVQTAAISAIYVTLENMALKHVKKAKSQATSALADAKKIRRKLQGLYNKDSDSLIMMNPSLALGGQGQGQLQMAQVANSGDQAGAIDGSLETPKSQCLDENNNVTSCPCSGGQCKQFSLNLPGNTKLEAQLSKKMNFASYEKGLNDVANGNINGLDFAADPNKSAIAKKVANRLLTKGLSMKGVSKKTKDVFKDIQSELNGNPALIGKYANIKSPLQTALLANKFGIGAGGLSLDTVSESDASAQDAEATKDAKKNKGLATYSGTSLSDIQKKLKALQDGINLDDVDDVLGPDSKEVAAKDGQLIDKGLAADEIEADTEKAVVHPDEKLSIFKIISNRYNILRVKKRFAK